MTTQDLQQIIAILAKRRKAFWSEADFQFELAQEIKTMFPAAQIRLERPFPNSVGKRNYIDIVVELNGELFPIELKYKTKEATITDFSGESILLQNHSATDFGCYDYLKDIYRLEVLKSIANHQRGFAIMLTNDPAYHNNTQRVSAYDGFKIYEGATRGGLLNWGLTTKGLQFVCNGRGSFSLSGTYKMQLNTYNNTFRYLINEI